MIDFLANANALEPTSLFAIVSMVVGGLSTAIVGLWRYILKRFAFLEQQYEKCEAKHEVANQTVIELSEKLGRVEGRLEELTKPTQVEIVDNPNG